MYDKLTSPIKLALVKDEDRDFVLSLEASILNFIKSNDDTDNNPITDHNCAGIIAKKDENNHVECLYLEPNLNSYYRLLSHQIAEYYGLQHFLIKRKNLIMLKKRKTENDSSQSLVLPDKLRDISIANLKKELITNGYYTVQNELNNTTAITSSKKDIQENDQSAVKNKNVEYRSDSPQPHDFETSSYKIELQERQQIYYTDNYINANSSNGNKRGGNYISINGYSSKNNHENNISKINNNNGMVSNNKAHAYQKYYSGTVTNKTKNYCNNNNLNYKHMSLNNTNTNTFLNSQNQMWVPMVYQHRAPIPIIQTVMPQHNKNITDTRHFIPIRLNNNANTVISSTPYSSYSPVNSEHVLSHSSTSMRLLNVMSQDTDIGTISEIDHQNENRFEVLEQEQGKFVTNSESHNIGDVDAGDNGNTKNVENKKTSFVLESNNNKNIDKNVKNDTTITFNSVHDVSLGTNESYKKVTGDDSDSTGSSDGNNGGISCASSTSSGNSSFNNTSYNYQEYAYCGRNYDINNNDGVYQYHYPYNKGKINYKQDCRNGYKNNYKNKNIKSAYYNNNNNAIYNCNTFPSNNNNGSNQENFMYFRHPNFQQQQQQQQQMSNFFPIQMLSVSSLSSVPPLSFGMVLPSTFVPVSSNNMPNNIVYNNSNFDFAKTRIGYYGQFATNTSGITSNTNTYYYNSHVHTCDNRFAMKYGNYYYNDNIRNNFGRNNIKLSSKQGHNRNDGNIFYTSEKIVQE
ncbi:uncharacterized protein SCODWIG_00962 [Saccharomycodes ludwigii]|uniref:R3H domain-containing protein n=1 Tax=Saccharomycodes ludwigii TaxID=36035 RepID=A0A376B3H2_9ASCO|nr:uncharacterized protein SCODWIG_00962 [Saccharomycodes ludwigii]